MFSASQMKPLLTRLGVGPFELDSFTRKIADLNWTFINFDIFDAKDPSSIKDCLSGGVVFYDVSIWTSPSTDFIGLYGPRSDKFDEVHGFVCASVTRSTETILVITEADAQLVLDEIARKGRISQQLRRHLQISAAIFLSRVDEIISKTIADSRFPMFGFNKRVLLIGSGGREHAIALKLEESYAVSHIFVAPGNGGTAMASPKISNIALDISSVKAIQEFVISEKIDLVVVGPEQPLVDGVTDAMNEINIPCFGPTANAAIVEASKAWSKDFMSRHKVQTAEYRNFNDLNQAKDYIRSISHRVVVKASGLAAGKGVIIPANLSEALEAIDFIMGDSKAFGDAGAEVVIEQYIDGEEVSLLAFTDGVTVRGMPGAQDHKRVFDNDQGPNTGGMGAYAPAPVLTPALRKVCMDVMQRVVDGMRNEGRLYRGVLYGGFMIPKDALEDPYVIEFNCRFGDPETQVLLPLLDSDLFDIFFACSVGCLDEINIKWKTTEFACTVVCAAGGYPDKYGKGFVITGLPKERNDHATVYHAGTTTNDGNIVTNGGRVLAVTGLGKSLQEAVGHSYDVIRNISFDGKHYRKDIAYRGISKPIRIGVLGSTRGSSLQPVIDAIENNSLVGVKIAIVVSNKSDAPILDRARNHHIKNKYILCPKGMSRDDYDAQVTNAFEEESVDIILCVGYMRILSASFVKRWERKCINVHPSLLPDFAGGMDLQVHSDVIKAGKQVSGCTVHLVTEEVDGGPIVIQKPCPVLPDDTPETLKGRVQPLEGIAFIEAISQYVAKGSFVGASLNADTLTYKDAGVDIDAGEALVKVIGPYCKATRRPGCDAELGGFGGLFDLSQAGYNTEDTVLVSGTDGVGTKLKIAQTIGIHDTIGIDLVAMCVNDVLVCGAEPLFFLDYYATGHLNVPEAADVVKGIAEGCRQSGSALIGGETAEMAGMYSHGEYDLAGFSVGAVRRGDILPRNIMVSDVIIGLKSSGVHSNGYSLVRKCVEKSGLSWSDPAPYLIQDSEKLVTLGESLLTPTRIYVKLLLPLIKAKLIKGLAHITGGGVLDNIPRVLPKGVDAVLDATICNWTLPPVFKWLQSIANLPQSELLRTWNCGIGMIIVVAQGDVHRVCEKLQSEGEEIFILGQIESKAEGKLQEEPKVVMRGEVI